MNVLDSTKIAGPPDMESVKRLASVTSILASRLMRAMRKLALQHDLSFPQIMIIWNLSRKKDFSSSRLAEMVGTFPSTATSIVDGLESSGYVHRKQDTADRRRVSITLSAKGRVVVDQLRDEGLERWKEMCSEISADELNAAASILEKIVSRRQNEQETDEIKIKKEVA